MEKKNNSNNNNFGPAVTERAVSSKGKIKLKIAEMTLQIFFTGHMELQRTNFRNTDTQRRQSYFYPLPLPLNKIFILFIKRLRNDEQYLRFKNLQEVVKDNISNCRI